MNHDFVARVSYNRSTDKWYATTDGLWSVNGSVPVMYKAGEQIKLPKGQKAGPKAPKNEDDYFDYHIDTSAKPDPFVDAYVALKEKRQKFDAEEKDQFAQVDLNAIARANLEQTRVNHPPHYAHPSGIECIEVTRHMNFNLGNVFKYIWREGKKDADAIEDLEKAAWYLADEIARRKRLKG